MLDIRPDNVAAYAPNAPPVTAHHIEEAQDWADTVLEKCGVQVPADSRQERALRRAIMNYSLYAAVGHLATSYATTDEAVKGVVAERKKVGPLEKEVKYGDAKSKAANLSASAADYLRRAWQALRIVLRLSGVDLSALQGVGYSR